MKYLYDLIANEILCFDSSITIKVCKHYFSFKCVDLNKKRSFADIYVQRRKIRIQILKSNQYLDPKNILSLNNENWTLGQYLEVKDEDEMQYAISLMKQSFKFAKDKLK